MKKTYATSMPNHIGAFLKASKCVATLGLNITRVSYDNSVDTHMLFLDVEGTPEQIRQADLELEKIGYLQNRISNSSIVLIEFTLKDVPGSATEILELINTFNFNISYINSQENGTDYQNFKIGLYVEDSGLLSAFLAQAEQLCKVRRFAFRVVLQTLPRGAVEIKAHLADDAALCGLPAPVVFDQDHQVKVGPLVKIARTEGAAHAHHGEHAGQVSLKPRDHGVDQLLIAHIHALL